MREEKTARDSVPNEMALAPIRPALIAVALISLSFSLGPSARAQSAAPADTLLAPLDVLPGSARETEGDPIPVPTDWETYYALILSHGPNYASELTAEELQALMDAHIQYQLRLVRDGAAVVAGGFGEAPDGLLGLTLLRAGSLEDAQRLGNGDPAVQTGRFRATVVEWWVPAGRLIR